MAETERTDEILTALGEGLPSWQQALRAGSRSIQSLGSEAINAATSLAGAGDAAEKMSGVMDAGNRLVGATLGQLPAIGGAVAGSASLITDAFKALLNVLMSGYHDFANLSKVGAAGTASLEDLKNSAKDAGIPLFAFGKYTDIIAENSSALAMMGGTVGDARIQFDGLLKDVHHVEGAYTKQLLLMGMNQEEILEFAGGYTKILARTGRASNMTSKQMAESTYKAAKEMDSLARITGIQKADLLKEQNKAYSHSRFRMAIREAELSGDADLVRKGEMAAKMYALAEKSPAMQKAIADTFTGVINTGEALGYQILTQGGLREALFADSSKSAAERMQMVAEAVDGGLDQFASVEAKAGYLSKVLGVDAAEAADFVKTWEGGGATIKKAQDETTTRLQDKDNTLTNIIDSIIALEKARESIDEQIIALLHDGSELFKKGADWIEKGATNFSKIIDDIKLGWTNFSKSYIGRKIFGDLTDEDKLATAMIEEKGVLKGGYTQKARHALVMEQMGLDPKLRIRNLGDRAGEYQEKMKGLKLRGSSKDQLDIINKKAMDLKRKQILEQASHEQFGGDLLRTDLQEYLRDKFLHIEGGGQGSMEKELTPEAQLELIEKMGLDADKQNKLLEDIRRLMNDQVLIQANN